MDDGWPRWGGKMLAAKPTLPAGLADVGF